MFVWGLLGTVLCIAAAPEGASRLAVIQKAAEFSLTTQAGETLRSSDLKREAGRLLRAFKSIVTCGGVIVVWRLICYNQDHGEENRKRSINIKFSAPIL